MLTFQRQLSFRTSPLSMVLLLMPPAVLADQTTLSSQPAAPSAVEISVVMPCLDEADTLATCISKARQALEEDQLNGEIIVADNGSRDGSQAIAARMGARLVPVVARGYGNALMGGIAAARGKWVVMGDADDSYDFRAVPQFVRKLREGADIVQGCRLPAGGGTVLPGAMPWSHRWIGNPLFSSLSRLLFRSPFHDVYCGMRGFTKAYYEKLDQRCTGMEFAIEMIVKASLIGGRLAEVPITLHPDGRVAHPPHLRTYRDGWRTLRFLLLYSPRWLFLIPGLVLILLGVLGYAIAWPGVRILGIQFDAHTLLVSSLAILMGYQSVLFAIFTKTFAVSERLLPPDPRLERFLHRVNLERGLLAAAVALCLGLFLIAGAFVNWRNVGFGPLDYSATMRWVIPGVTSTALGFETILASFFVSVLRLGRR